MNIAALQTFLTVVQSGNLNKAADQLNVTQSTVTTRLDVLEEALGQKLLVRSRKGAELTKAGFVFQRHAELVTQAWDQARKAVGLPRGFSAMFAFACHDDLWDGAGANWLDKIRRSQPELALEAWAGDLGELKRWLASGLIDAALATEPLSGAGLSARQVASDRLVLVASSPRELMTWDPEYIYVDLGPEFRRQHSLAWPVDETAYLTFGSSRWARDHLIAKGGSGYLPWRMAEAHVRSGQLHLVPDAPEFSRALHLTWREASRATHPWMVDETLWTEAD